MNRLLPLGFIAAAALAITGCGQADQATARSTVTVKLPPAQPAAAKPGFSDAPETGFQP